MFGRQIKDVISILRALPLFRCPDGFSVLDGITVTAWLGYRIPAQRYGPDTTQ